MKHKFTETIISVLETHFGTMAQAVFDSSPLIQYLNVKTRSANRGSKSRGSFANHYALYVLVEDYINKGFIGEERGTYGSYEGARFTDLFRRQRELPFGAKLQNHALNSRLNDEFSKYFPTLEFRPIMRDQKEQRYWVSERLLTVEVIESGKSCVVNIASAVIEIIDSYVQTKRSAFEAFIESCNRIAQLADADAAEAIQFVREQLEPNVDARVFEIVSFAVLKAHYGEQTIFWGWTPDDLQEEGLVLYKTGRTNANDGGIDFVMRPLGRFFQVTETIDANKYFLDIDKIQRFPLTFVVKTVDEPEKILNDLRDQAHRKYGVDAIVNRYMEAVEEIINSQQLLTTFESLTAAGRLSEIMAEIVRQSRVEFNFGESDEDSEELGDEEGAL
jgi:hypothetical protein